MIEFEDSLSRSLVAQTVSTLATGTVSAVVLMIAALLFWNQARARERAQRRLEQQQRLSDLGKMSAVLAHEIRNPLASLKGHAQLLAERIDRGEEAGARHPEARKIRRIVDEATRLEKLTTDLLDFVRSGSLERRSVDPVQLVRDARTDVDGDRIRIDDTAAPDRWILDPERLREVLSNLLRNALQASPAEAPVEVTIGCSRKSSSGTELQILVRDHGPGLPAGQEQEIFQPFFTTRTRGTGLGLAVARRIVELHGGTLSGQNHPGGGAELQIRIPES